MCEDWSAIRCPVLAVGGWADPYPAVPLRLAAAHAGPRPGADRPVGPRRSRTRGCPAPAIGWLQECLRFLDHHLKGVDNGEDAEPRVRLWMQDPVPPRTTYDERPGRWVAEAGLAFRRASTGGRWRWAPARWAASRRRPSCGWRRAWRMAWTRRSGW